MPSTLSEVAALGEILLDLVERELVDPLFVLFAEVECNLLDGRRDEQQIGIDLACQQRGCQVLVDDRGNARRSPFASVTTGIPPPPTAMVTTPASSSCLMTSSSTMRIGSGDATTRRQPRPASSVTSQFSFGTPTIACSSSMNEPMGLLGFCERRIVWVNLDLGHHGGDALFDTAMSEVVHQVLLQQ